MELAETRRSREAGGVDLPAGVLAELESVVGAGHLLVEPGLRAGFERDISGRFGAPAAAVARPADTEQVARLLEICNRNGIAVVPQGGNTGLVGGGVPRGGELVVSLQRLQHLGEVDRSAQQVVVGAGVTLERLQEHALAAGLGFGTDLGARSAATIGGMVATNAGGALAMRYGTMRAQVAGVEAVLADGTVWRRLSGLLKDNAGYDLTALLIGSEGTLAIVTKVALRLRAIPRARVTALFGLPGLDDALALVTSLRERAPSLFAADFFEASGMALVRSHRSLRQPLEREWPTYVVAELAADRDPTAELAAAVEGPAAELDVAVADDSAGRAGLWAYRELQNEAVRAAGVPHGFDVSVPISDVPRFAAATRSRVAEVDPKAETIFYGHLGDGNVHVNVLGLDPGDERVDEAVLELVGAHGGSISAEHGVGVAKRRYLHLCRSDAEIAAMRRLRQAFDPAGILNPGCVLPDAPSARS